MNNDPSNIANLIEQLSFATNFSIQQFKQTLEQINQHFFTQNPKHKNIVFPIIDMLIIEERFYDNFSLHNYSSSSFNQADSCKNQKQVLQFGFSVLQEVFSSPLLVENDNFVLSPMIKKCKIDIFVLIAICKGYLQNGSARRDKVKSFFVQSFKKNSHYFVGLQNFSLFHQYLVERSSSINLFTSDLCKKERQHIKLAYFLEFYTSCKDFFPSTLQIDNALFRMMASIKLDAQQDIQLYQMFQKSYIHQNLYHLTTTCKNIRFVIEFFRNPFNQKASEFYPQKNFVRLLAKYSKSEVEKIVSFSEVGLAWGEAEISVTISNIFKLGLTNVTSNFFKSLLAIWLKNGFVDVVTKLAETYIPKTFIFLKHEKLFDISFDFLKELTLGPRNPTKGIMNKLLQKLLMFSQKQCPVNKKSIIHEFICLIETKYEKVATLEDSLYIDLKNHLKNIRDGGNKELPVDQKIQQKLKQNEWQQIKVPLFSSTSPHQSPDTIAKQAGEYKGLYNIGNSCYMNSFLQCLFMNIEFRKCVLDVSTLALEKNLLQKFHQAEAKNQTEQLKAKQISEPNKNIQLMARQLVRPAAELQRLFAQLIKSKRSAISPLTIKNVSSPEFKNTFQQDTIEFGRSFIDIISKSTIQNMFQGEQTNQIVCPHCGQSRFKKQNFIDLMLTEVEDEEEKVDERASSTTKQSSNGGVVIEKMLRKFFEPEQMQGLSCDYCHTKSQKSTKKHFISKFPNYLILTMKRFHYDIKENKNIKKHYNVDLKEGFMNLEGELYQLYGIIVHRGQSANSGHYFAFCREWKCDVQSQKTVQQNNILERKDDERMIDESEVDEGPKFKKMQIEPQEQINQVPGPVQQNLIKKSKSFVANKDRRWLCLNDSTASIFDSFQNVKQFLDLNQQDTPYVLFYEKVSHIASPESQHLKDPIKLRQPLEKFLEKDNIEHAKVMENKKRGNANGQKVDWKNFGKVKGFTAYDYFKFSKDQEDYGGGGNAFGGGFGNNPIL